MEEKREKERGLESGERDPLGLGSTSLLRDFEDGVYGIIVTERGGRGGRGQREGYSDKR